MFRCITELKALIIDIESFSDIEVARWKVLYNRFKCLFIVSEEVTEGQVKNEYPNSLIYRMEKFIKLFAPSQSSHSKMLRLLEREATEVAYISMDIGFLNNAMNFLGGTIWVTNSVNYEGASKAPDLVCPNFDAMTQLLVNNVKGFLGEVVVYPEVDSRGMIIPVEFEISNDTVPLYMLGRYFGYSHYMNQLHPYSTAIALNKKEGKAYYRKFDDIFSRLYICAVKHIQNTTSIDGVISVPTRPRDTDRFDRIRDSISKECGIKNLGGYFKCIKDYPTQKNLSSLERQANIEGVFNYEGDLTGKSVIVIDDIITTGSTIRECIHELNNHGTSQIFVIALAINQMQGTYWSADSAQVTCPNCGKKMHLLVNSHSRHFFYSCYSCNNTLSFEAGRAELYDIVNSECFRLMTAPDD